MRLACFRMGGENGFGATTNDTGFASRLRFAPNHRRTPSDRLEIGDARKAEARWAAIPPSSSGHVPTNSNGSIGRDELTDKGIR